LNYGEELKTKFTLDDQSVFRHIDFDLSSSLEIDDEDKEALFISNLYIAVKTFKKILSALSKSANIDDINLLPNPFEILSEINGLSIHVNSLGEKK